MTLEVKTACMYSYIKKKRNENLQINGCELGGSPLPQPGTAGKPVRAAAPGGGREPKAPVSVPRETS